MTPPQPPGWDNPSPVKNLLPTAAALACLPLIICGCASAKPTVKAQNSYDYTKPQDIADRGKPVWVLPSINYGWQPAHVNAQGQWIGGHYTATVMSEGYWATQEEAQMAGKPFLVAGKGKPVVPQTPASGTGGAELEVSQLQSRVEKLEDAMPAKRDQQSLDELVLASGDANRTASTGGVRAEEIPQPQLRVMGGAQAPSEAAAPSPAQPSPTARQGALVLKPQAPGTRETKTLPDGSVLEIEHLPGYQARINHNGKTSTVSFGPEWKKVPMGG